MAVTLYGSLDQNTAVIGTEYFVPAAAGYVTDTGTFQMYVDLNTMLAGDVVELRVYARLLTGDTTRVCYFMPYYGVQPTDDLIKVSVPISTDLTEDDALRFSFKQTFGTGRRIKAKVLKFA